MIEQNERVGKNSKNTLQNSRDSEEILKIMTEQSIMGIGILQDNEFKYLNQKFSDITGYSIEELNELVPSEYGKIIHQEDLHLVIEQAMKKQQGEKGSIDHYVYRGFKKTGELIWLENHSRTIIYEGKSADLVMIIDITEKMKAEQKLRELLESRKKVMRELAKELELKTRELIQKEKLASLGLLAAAVAHEINNPLMGIINYAEIIKENVKRLEVDTNSKPFSFMDGIIKEAGRIAKITSDLMTYSNEETVKFTLGDVNEVIYPAITLLSPKLEENMIELSLNPPENLPKIPMIAQNLQQVMINIIQNSMDALNEKFGIHVQKKLKKISIKTSLENVSNKNYVKITILDNGQGIKEENLVKVFDPFFTTRLHSNSPGKGLGLAISYNIIKSHGGRIKIHSEWKKFTIIEILLPLNGEKNESLIKQANKSEVHR